MLANQFLTGDGPGGFATWMSPHLLRREDLIEECRTAPSQAVTVHRSHGRNAGGRHSGVGSASRHAVQTACKRVKSVASCRRLEMSPRRSGGRSGHCDGVAARVTRFRRRRQRRLLLRPRRDIRPIDLGFLLVGYLDSRAARADYISI